MEAYVESFTESLSHPKFSVERFLKDEDYEDNAIEKMFTTYNEYTSIKASLSSVVVVCLRVNGEIRWRKEQGDLVDQVVRCETLEKHILAFCWTDRKSKSSTTDRWKTRNTNSRLIMTKEVYEN